MPVRLFEAISCTRQEWNFLDRSWECIKVRKYSEERTANDNVENRYSVNKS
jgi:hypothetical protein